MTLSTRIAGFMLTGVLTANLSMGSTMPAPKGSEAGSAEMLPTMMDASSSYTDTGNASPTRTTGPVAAPTPQAQPAAGLQAQVASGQFSPAANGPGTDHQQCLPEPVSIILMSTGLVGLLAARRLKK